MGSFKDTIIGACKKVAETTVGKQFSRFGNAINNVESQLIKAEKKATDAVSKHLNLCAENVVEQAVPGKVLNEVDRQLAKKATKEASKKAKSLAPEAALCQGSKAVNNAAQEVSKDLSMAEVAQQRFEETKPLRDVLDKRVEELSKTVSHERCGELINMDIDYFKIEKLEAETISFYDFMRSTNDDIKAIGKNTGISKDILDQIKKHVFSENHILREGIMSFDPHVDMAAAWKRLIKGDFLYSDLLLLQHEYAESLIMQGIKTPYSPAHEVVNKIYNWEKSYRKDI